MNSTHLTDETLQELLLEKSQDAALTEHLATCADCRMLLETYRILTGSLSQLTPEVFSFDVSTVVMESVMLYEKKKSRRQAILFWILLIFSVAIVVSLSIPFLPEMLAVVHTTSFFTTLLVLGTGVFVLLFLLADMYRQFKVKTQKIMEQPLQPNNEPAV